MQGRTREPSLLYLGKFGKHMNFQLVPKIKNAKNLLLAYSPNLAQSWLLFVIVVLCHFAGFAVKAIVQYIPAVTPEWSQLLFDVSRYIVLALVIVRFGKRGNDMPVIPARQSPALWFLLVPLTLSVSITAVPLTMWIPRPDFFKQMFEDLSNINLPVFLSLVVIAPVCEEWLCRGIILKGLLKHYSPRKAIVWSSVIFGVVHFNPWQGVSAFFIGLAIGWIYWRTRSLRYCVFMHAVNNGTLFLLSFLFQDVHDDRSLADIAGGYYIYAVTFFVCVLCLLGTRKLFRSRV